MIDEITSLKALVRELLAATLRDKVAVDNGDGGNAYELLAIFAKHRDNPVRFEGGTVRITSDGGLIGQVTLTGGNPAAPHVTIAGQPTQVEQEAAWRKLFWLELELKP